MLVGIIMHQTQSLLLRNSRIHDFKAFATRPTRVHLGFTRVLKRVLKRTKIQTPLAAACVSTGVSVRRVFLCFLPTRWSCHCVWPFNQTLQIAQCHSFFASDSEPNAIASCGITGFPLTNESLCGLMRRHCSTDQ